MQIWNGDLAPIVSLVDGLSVAEKVSLLTGRDAWSTRGLERIGLRSMRVSDGPSGVRGEVWDERSPSLLLPSATALSATWDVDLARRFGTVIAAQARRKAVDVVLGPTVNLHRSPLGGRHFEAFSEDPLLTARLAAAYIEGVQAGGVAAAVKHFVANDSETDRFVVDVRVGDRALRELYLRPFEEAVTKARTWLVMSAYNSVNGTRATESELLEHPLNDDWDFDGVVVSDWTAVRSLDSARRPQDLAMPGPESPWGAALVNAVEGGDISVATIDRKVVRLLVLAARVGALDGYRPSSSAVAVEDPVAFARHAAADGAVLLRNDGILPLSGQALQRVAIIGHHALRPRSQGGGSATVIPEHVVSPVEGLRRALPASVLLDVSPGVVIDEGISALDPGLMANPVTGGPGAHVQYLDAEGREIFAEERFAGFIMDFGREETAGTRSLVFTTEFTPEGTATLHFGFAAPGTGRVFIDGNLLLARELEPDRYEADAFFAPPSASAPVAVVAGTTVAVRFEFEPLDEVDGVPGSFAVTFGLRPDPGDGDLLIRNAAEAARLADAAVVFVGSSSELETEGTDRTDLRLPGRQDDLVRAVAAANPRTIAVINAGAPVEMPWREEVAAVLLGWFGGQETGDAWADVLLGHREPGGRLPTTWPVQLSDAPVVDVVPVDGVLNYDEGIYVGYRAWLQSGVPPAYPFGHGLGYTEWTLDRVELATATDSGDIGVKVSVTNVGSRAGKQVIQVYAHRDVSAVDRPARWLVGFAVVRAAPGDTHDLVIPLARRDFAYWDDGWVHEPGEYELLVGTSLEQISATVKIRL